MNDIEKILEGRKVVKAYQKRHADFGEGKLGKVKHEDLEIELAQGLEQVGLTIGELSSLESQYTLELVPYSEFRDSKFRMIVATPDPNRPKGLANARFNAVRKAVSEGRSPYTILFSTTTNPTLSISKVTVVNGANVCQIGPSKTSIDMAKCKELSIAVNVSPDSTTNFGSLTTKGDFSFQLLCPGIRYRTMQYIMIAFLKRLGLDGSIGDVLTEVTVNGRVIASYSCSRGEKIDRGSTLTHSVFDYGVAAAVFQVEAEEIERSVTSLQNELGVVPAIADVADALKRVFIEDFASDVTEGSYSDYELSEVAKTMQV